MYSVRILDSNQPAQTVCAADPRAAAQSIRLTSGAIVIVSNAAETYRYRVSANGRLIEQSRYSA